VWRRLPITQSSSSRLLKTLPVIGNATTCRRISSKWPSAPSANGRSRGPAAEACQAMGREQAGIAIAIVSAKPTEHFRSTPGGYFHGMVAKAKAGELNLGRTIWGLRGGERNRAGQGVPGRRPRSDHDRVPHLAVCRPDPAFCGAVTSGHREMDRRGDFRPPCRLVSARHRQTEASRVGEHVAD
jgi:hypothetical protein